MTFVKFISFNSDSLPASGIPLTVEIPSSSPFQIVNQVRQLDLNQIHDSSEAFSDSRLQTIVFAPSVGIIGSSRFSK
jgi:hypothetical protein